MKPRIENPVIASPEALRGLQRFSMAAKKSSELPETLFHLVEIRASQINGCSVCLDMHTREMKTAGEADQRVLLVGAWREAPYFSDAERAALALAEAATRLADRPDPVSDEVWEEAARHYSEQQLAALVVAIATINAFNRINVSTRQITGGWVEQIALTSVG